MTTKRAAIKSVRQLQLIQATLEVIDRVGLESASIVLIAKQAGLSTGIISHYFGDKNGLLVAVMQHIMNNLSAMAKEQRAELVSSQNDTVRNLLTVIIDVNLSPEQTSSSIVKTWLAFWVSSMHQTSLGRLNKINERRLYSNLYYQFNRELPAEKAKQAAIGLSALIEGLWLRKALLDESFTLDMARSVAYDYLDHVLPAKK